MTEKVNVVIPSIGESVTEGTIGKWFFKEGDLVQKDQPLFELDSDKATLEVPATASGKLSILIPAGKTASVGSLAAVIEAMEGALGAQAPSPRPSVSPATSVQSRGAENNLPKRRIIHVKGSLIWR